MQSRLKSYPSVNQCCIFIYNNNVNNYLTVDGNALISSLNQCIQTNNSDDDVTAESVIQLLMVTSVSSL